MKINLLMGIEVIPEHALYSPSLKRAIRTVMGPVITVPQKLTLSFRWYEEPTKFIDLKYETHALKIDE
jgi:hypothetical protein